MQEKLINRTLLELQDQLSGDQLKKLKDVLTVECANYLIVEQKNEVVIYDETSDIAAYKQFFVSKKIQGLSSGTLNLYMQTINLFMRSIRKPFSYVTTNDIRLFIANREMIDNVSKGLSPTLTTNKGEGPKVVVDAAAVLIREATAKGYTEAFPGDSVNIRHPKSYTRRGRVGKGIASTLLTGESQAVVTEEYQIRKLTPRECWRLQGFPDWAFDRAKEVNSDSQLYKQAGNSVTVPVIHDIARRLVSYPTK